MAAPLSICTKADRRAVIRFLFAKGVVTFEINKGFTPSANKKDITALLGADRQYGHGSLVIKVTDSRDQRVMSSSLLPLNTRRVGQRCLLNLSRAQTFCHWCGVVIRRGVRAQVFPGHLTMVQNHEVHRQKLTSS
ncbi:hypothetical protein TNCV_3492911 [Trichonephila clavipes]|nr:hypothetical protein TNCV_3492911 [Trichonephila clavipes]